jgi:hypothetical protein
MMRLLHDYLFPGILVQLCCFFSLSTYAQQDPAIKVPFAYSVGAGLSTTGISAEGVIGISPKLNLKLGGHFFRYSYRAYFGETDFIYNMKLKLASFSLIGEWHPLKSKPSCYVSGGVFLSLNKIEYRVNPDGILEVGALKITEEEAGSLDLTFKAKKIAPYLGLGYGKSIPGNKWGWQIEAGAMYIGTPGVDFTGTGLISPIAEQKAIVEKNISWMKIYPVLSVMVYYKIR